MVLSFLGQDIIDLRLFLSIQLSTLQLSQASAGLPGFDKSFSREIVGLTGWISVFTYSAISLRPEFGDICIYMYLFTQLFNSPFFDAFNEFQKQMRNVLLIADLGKLCK